jgi:hypothetical protein
LVSAAQVALSEQVPVPLVIVTVAPAMEHAPLAVMAAAVLPSVVDATVNAD